ncbi:MAG: hypothetical protein ABR566_18410 [Pyrinomonadaceae bacterium]
MFRRRTLEMTWGETDYTQAERNHATPNESRCFALTSIGRMKDGLFRLHPTRSLTVSYTV